MPEAIDTKSLVSTPASFIARVSLWNRRLLIGSAVLLLWAASILALHEAGPNAQAMLAGEGMLIVPVQVQ
jgi:hypothetical protein